MTSPVKKIVRRLKETRLPRVSVKPSATVTIVLMIAVSVFLLAGGVYNIMMKPLVLLPSPGFPIFYYYGLHEQTWSESLAAMILFLVGFAGAFVSYKSTRYAYKPRQAATLLLIGVALLIISFIGCEYIISLKRGI